MPQAGPARTKELNAYYKRKTCSKRTVAWHRWPVGFRDRTLKQWRLLSCAFSFRVCDKCYARLLMSLIETPTIDFYSSDTLGHEAGLANLIWKSCGTRWTLVGKVQLICAVEILAGCYRCSLCSLLAPLHFCESVWTAVKPHYTKLGLHCGDHNLFTVNTLFLTGVIVVLISTKWGAVADYIPPAIQASIAIRKWRQKLQSEHSWACC